MAAPYSVTTSVSGLGTSNSYTTAVTYAYGALYGQAPYIGVGGTSMTSWSIAFSAAAPPVPAPKAD